MPLKKWVWNKQATAYNEADTVPMYHQLRYITYVGIICKWNLYSSQFILWLTLGVTKPEEYGGLGLDFSYSIAFNEALGHVDCGAVPMSIAVQTDMSTPALAK